jgi:photosystem II stability/assembly factor-like uncharacterized protein
VTVGDAGTILASTNGGGVWTPQASGSVANLNGVVVFGANAVAVGDAGTILTAAGYSGWTSRTVGVGKLRGITCRQPAI